MSKFELFVEIGDKVRFTGEDRFHYLYQKEGIVERVFSDNSFYVNFGKGPVEFFSDECEGVLELVS